MGTKTPHGQFRVCPWNAVGFSTLPYPLLALWPFAQTLASSGPAERLSSELGFVPNPDEAPTALGVWFLKASAIGWASPVPNFTWMRRVRLAVFYLNRISHRMGFK
jgi:hypothetical protein